MKKLPFVLLIFLVITISCAVACADECEHEWAQTMGELVYEYREYSDTHHQKITLEWFRCKKCNVLNLQPSTVVMPVLGKHDLDYVRDLGHTDGKTHLYLYKCTICEQEVVITQICFGPPCVSIGYRVNDPEIETDK